MAYIMAQATRDTSQGFQQVIRDVVAQNSRQLAQVVDQALRDNRRYERIQLDNVDPFNPHPSPSDRKGNERIETDVDVFLQSIVPSLRLRQVPDSVRIRSLYFHTRGAAKDFLRQFSMEGVDPTFERLVIMLHDYFRSRETADQILDRLYNVARRPGEDMPSYHQYMLKIGNKVLRADNTMEGTVLSVMWSKILKECPEYLRADLYERHSRTNMAAALSYIQQWISRHPEHSVFVNL